MWIVREFENYEIFYIVRNETIEIVQILLSARDVKRLFDSD